MIGDAVPAWATVSFVMSRRSRISRAGRRVVGKRAWRVSSVGFTVTRDGVSPVDEVLAPNSSRRPSVNLDEDGKEDRCGMDGESIGSYIMV